MRRADRDAADSAARAFVRREAEEPALRYMPFFLPRRAWLAWPRVPSATRKPVRAHRVSRRRAPRNLSHREVRGVASLKREELSPKRLTRIVTVRLPASITRWPRHRMK